MGLSPSFCPSKCPPHTPRAVRVPSGAAPFPLCIARTWRGVSLSVRALQCDIRRNSSLSCSCHRTSAVALRAASRALLNSRGCPALSAPMSAAAVASTTAAPMVHADGGAPQKRARRGPASGTGAAPVVADGAAAAMAVGQQQQQGRSLRSSRASSASAAVAAAVTTAAADADVVRKPGPRSRRTPAAVAAAGKKQHGGEAGSAGLQHESSSGTKSVPAAGSDGHLGAAVASYEPVMVPPGAPLLKDFGGLASGVVRAARAGPC